MEHALPRVLMLFDSMASPTCVANSLATYMHKHKDKYKHMYATHTQARTQAQTQAHTNTLWNMDCDAC